MTLLESLQYSPNELSFGTSGLRDLVTDMTDVECFINATGFLRFLSENDNLQPAETVYIAGDLRDSTPRIMQVMFEACAQYGMQAINCGLIPTPAAAYFAYRHKSPSVIVTGSHIPSDRNGIKFYKRGGEVLKSDETSIQKHVAQVRSEVYNQDPSSSQFNNRGMFKKPIDLPEVLAEAEQVYRSRYIDFFPSNCLEGKKVIVYQHSAVGRDLLVGILEVLGAIVTAVERSDTFISIDSENVTDANKEKFKTFATNYPDSFAIVSTDGDSDRPFVIDEKGVFHRGDMLGCVTADFLGAKFAAVPISSNDAVGEFCNSHGIKLSYTKIGSPYVIEAMNNAAISDQPIVSWEVNGGFLIGSDVARGSSSLDPLPTRDAILPIICALLSAAKKNKKVSELFGELAARYTGGSLIDNVPPTKIAHFKKVCGTPSEVENLIETTLSDVGLGNIQKIDLTDGLRLMFDSGNVVHLRPSGNAPQFRVYTNASSQAEADTLAYKAVCKDGYIEKILAEL